jgi:hypothetical protein
MRVRAYTSNDSRLMLFRAYTSNDSRFLLVSPHRLLKGKLYW